MSSTDGVPASTAFAHGESDELDLFEYIMSGLATTGARDAPRDDLVTALGLNWERPVELSRSTSAHSLTPISPRVEEGNRAWAVEPSIIPLGQPRKKPTKRTARVAAARAAPRRSFAPPPLFADTARMSPKKQLSVTRALRARTTTVDDSDNDSSSFDDDDDGDDDFTPGSVEETGGRSSQSGSAREKKRAAVRNCRKRKRETESKLIARAETLERENESLVRMKAILEVLDSDNADLTGYTFSDRTTAVEFLLQRLEMAASPDDRTRLYLWLGTRPDEMFSRTNGVWASISSTVQITATQRQAMRNRKVALLAANLSVETALDALRAFSRRRGVPSIDTDEAMLSLFTPEQLAQLEDVAAATEFANSDLTAFVNKLYTPSVVDECPTDIPLASRPPTQDQISDARTVATRQIANMMSTVPFNELVRTASSVCVEDVVLMEPVNLHQKQTVRGVREVCNFVKRLRLAFVEDSFLVEEKEMLITANGLSRRCTWLLTGTYCGRLKPAQEGGGRRVSFVVVATASFTETSISKMTELVVSWDVLGLLLQIGLIGPNATTRAATLVAESTPSTHGSMSKEELIRARDAAMDNLKELFESAATSTPTCLAPNAVFMDANMGGTFRTPRCCADYIRRMRRPFPWMKITQDKVEFYGSDRIKIRWRAKAAYGGRLGSSTVSPPPTCTIVGTLFVTFMEKSDKIAFVEMSWDAAALLEQLGLVDA